jgi:tRNA nucleotidyltransferase/poly(A) polymerase
MKKINWKKFKDPMVQAGVELMNKVNSMGFEAYVVGGAVRDIAMGDENVHDIDIATNMPIETIKKNFKTVEYGGGEKHGTVIVHYKGEDYELTQFRTEGDYSDNRRPDSVEFVQSFEEDTKRRDFTINAMGIDADGNVIDYHGGADDIKKGVLRTVGDSKERFTEDALRILRAVRFAARFNFKVDEKTMQSMKELKDTVSSTSIERIRDELFKTIDYGGDKFANALDLLQETGIWDVIVPEVDLTDAKIEQVRRANTNNAKVNFSILLLGLSINQIKDLGKRLTLTNDEIKSVAFVTGMLPYYGRLDQIPKPVALKMVVDGDFLLLRQTFIAVNGQDVKNADDKIQKISTFKAITDRQKQVNQFIMDAGIKGAKFGEVIKSINEWLFSEFEKGNEPSDEEVKSFIGNLL